MPSKDNTYLVCICLNFIFKCVLFWFLSHESANQPKCSSEAATPSGSPESPGWSDGWEQLQSATADETSAAADGEGKAETEAPRTASAGEATG